MDNENEHEIPVKVVDRRWWANPDAAAPIGRRRRRSSRPTSRSWNRQVAEKDRQIQEYLGKYRQASAEFDEARLRLRREISKDIERARREVLAEVLDVVDNLDRAIDAGRQAANPRGAAPGHRDGAAPVPRQAGGAGGDADRDRRRARSIRSCTRRSARCRPLPRIRMAPSSASSAAATASATTCCGPPPSRSRSPEPASSTALPVYNRSMPIFEYPVPRLREDVRGVRDRRAQGGVPGLPRRQSRQAALPARDGRCRRPAGHRLSSRRSADAAPAARPAPAAPTLTSQPRGFAPRTPRLRSLARRSDGALRSRGSLASARSRVYQIACSSSCRHASRRSSADNRATGRPDRRPPLCFL